MTDKQRTAMRAELVRLMLKLASLDRDEYRRLRTEMWESVARSHARKGKDHAAAWQRRAS